VQFLWQRGLTRHIVVCRRLYRQYSCWVNIPGSIALSQKCWYLSLKQSSNSQGIVFYGFYLYQWASLNGAAADRPKVLGMVRILKRKLFPSPQVGLPFVQVNSKASVLGLKNKALTTRPCGFGRLRPLSSKLNIQNSNAIVKLIKL